jgi:protein phosphatase
MTHVGHVRTSNQDHFLITRIARSVDVIRTSLDAGELPGQVEELAYGMVIADGMGGMAAGERASLVAIHAGLKLLLESPRWAIEFDEQETPQLIDRMRDYFYRVDDALVRHARADSSLTGMGTTLTLAYSAGADAFVVHAGDSRAYLFHDGELRPLTRDHTVAQRLADLGEIRPEEVDTHSTRHILTNYAGGSPRGIAPEITTVKIADGDRLLLCSDGLTGMVDDAEIAAILGRHADPEATARALVDRALERGGRDNVTVVLAHSAIAE